MTWDWSMVGEMMFVVGLALVAMGAIHGACDKQGRKSDDS
jgi:hypothetical protein